MHQQQNKNQEFVRASFNCDKDVLDAFRRVVAQKYGQLWGVLHKEFEEALRERKAKLEKELPKATSKRS
jgi:hypothetical protein